MPPAHRTFALFAAMADKDLVAMIRPLIDLVDEWWVCPLDSARAATPDALASLLAAQDARAKGVNSVAEACAAIAGRAAPGDRVGVFGSFYTVGPALQALGLYSPPASQVG